MDTQIYSSKNKNSIITLLVRAFFGIVRALPNLSCFKKTKMLHGSLALKRYSFDFNFWCTRSGVLWSAKSFPDLLTRHLLLEGTYQDDVLITMRHFLRPGAVFIDIGGHYGLMAIVASKAVGPQGKVVTFEPNPNAREHLSENLSLNKASNVTVVPIGLSDEVGKLDFFPQSGDVSWNSSFVRDFADKDHSVESLQVEVTTLDEYLADVALAPDVIKIDIEGFEIRALQGGFETIREHKPVLIMEFNPSSAKEANTTIGDIVKFLEDLSYGLHVLTRKCHSLFDFSDYALTHSEPFDEGKHCADDLANVICIPNGKGKFSILQ